MDSVWLFGKPHLTSLHLPENKSLGAGKYGDDIKQLLPRLGEAEQGCPHEHSSSMSIPSPWYLPKTLSPFPRDVTWNGIHHVFSNIFRMHFTISCSMPLQWERDSPFVTDFQRFADTSAPGMTSYRPESKGLQFRGQHTQQLYRSPNEFNITSITVEDSKSIRDNVNLFLAVVPLEIQLNAADTLLWLNAYNRYLCMQMAGYMWASNYLICMPRHGNSNVN